MNSKPSQYFSDMDVMYLSPCLKYNKVITISIKDFYLLHVMNVCYDEQAPKKEALENVLSSLKMEGINFIFLIQNILALVNQITAVFRLRISVQQLLICRLVPSFQQTDFAIPY